MNSLLPLKHWDLSIHIVTILGPKFNQYGLYVGGHLLCYTMDDDDGLKLAIAITIYQQRVVMTRRA